MATCPPLLVPAPPTTPAVGGLYSVASFPELPGDGNGNRWECGIQYEAATCARPEGWSGVCPPDLPDDKVATLKFPVIEGKPFTVILGVECRPIGKTLEEFAQAVARAFQLCEQAPVEQIYWTGSQGNNHLADPDCEVLAGATVDTPLTLAGGVAAIESFLGDNYCGVGVIHAPRALAPYAATHNLICQCGTPKMSTPLGTRWAFGGGYSVNTGPAGQEAPDGVAWLYVTGQVQILRSDIFINPDDLRYAFNTRKNIVQLFAERNYVITHECVCAAVPVQLGCNC